MKKYIVSKEKRKEEKVTFSKQTIDGYRITPKNNLQYDGIRIDSMLIVKPAFIDKLLKKKNQRMLDKYLQYMIALLESNDDDDNIRQALDDLARYRDVVEYKYRKYLDDKYINLLLKKIALVEQEIKSKMVYKEQLKIYQNINEKTATMETVEEKGKSR